MDQRTSCAHFEGGPEAKALAAAEISGLDRAPLSIDETRNAPFIALKRGTVTLLLNDETAKNVMTEGEAKPLFDFLALNLPAFGTEENRPKQLQHSTFG